MGSQRAASRRTDGACGMGLRIQDESDMVQNAEGRRPRPPRSRVLLPKRDGDDPLRGEGQECPDPPAGTLSGEHHHGAEERAQQKARRTVPPDRIVQRRPVSGTLRARSAPRMGRMGEPVRGVRPRLGDLREPLPSQARQPAAAPLGRKTGLIRSRTSALDTLHRSSLVFEADVRTIAEARPPSKTATIHLLPMFAGKNIKRA